MAAKPQRTASKSVAWSLSVTASPSSGSSSARWGCRGPHERRLSGRHAHMAAQGRRRPARMRSPRRSARPGGSEKTGDPPRLRQSASSDPRLSGDENERTGAIACLVQAVHQARRHAVPFDQRAVCHRSSLIGKRRGRRPRHPACMGQAAQGSRSEACSAGERAMTPRDALALPRWRRPEWNRRHHDFQSCALPTELPRPTAGRAGPTCREKAT